MQELSQDNLSEVLGDNSKVIVQYGASWCGACKLVKPTFQRLSTENEEVKFVYVDAENFPGSRALASVDNLPTFAGFVDGKLIKQITGTKVESIEGVLNEIASN